MVVEIVGIKNRKIQGLTQHKQNGWRIRTNDQLQLCTTTVQVCRLGWAGHVVRTPANKTVKKVFLGNPDGRRRVDKTQLSTLTPLPHTTYRWQFNRKDLPHVPRPQPRSSFSITYRQYKKIFLL